MFAGVAERRSSVVVALAALLLGVGALVLTGPAPPADAAAPAYDVLLEGELHPGVTWSRLRTGDPLAVDVARVAHDAPVRLVPVISGGQLYENPPAPRHATTSDMCASVGGVVCVNADYWICPTCGPPGGGVVVDGVPLRTPSAVHPQVTVLDDGTLTADELQIDVVLEAVFEPEEQDVVEGVLEEPEPPRTETLMIHELNRSIPDGVVLHSPAWATTTQRGPDTTEVTFGGPVPAIGTAGDVEIRAIGGNDAAIPGDGFVLVATGDARPGFADRLEEFRRADRLVLRVTANLPARMSTGGHPVILRDGQPVELEQRDPKVRNRHPRTIIGWNDAGDLWLLTIDGRQRGHSAGVTLREAADHVQQLGATDAMNLDGGGSSTFVTGVPCTDGRAPCVRNRPSDGRERRLSTALALVPTQGTSVSTTPFPPAPTPPPTTAPPPPTTTTAPPPPPPTTTTTTTPPPPTTAPSTTVPVSMPPRPPQPTRIDPELAAPELEIRADDAPRSKTLPAAAAASAIVVAGLATLRSWRRLHAGAISG